MVANERRSTTRYLIFQLVIALAMLGSCIGMAANSENHWPGIIVSACGAGLVVLAVVALLRGRSPNR